MIDFEVLKQELFHVNTEKKYKGEKIINIFLKDSSFVKQMVKQSKCSQDALDFLESNIQRLADVYNQVSIPYFRDIKYEEILLHYCENKSSLKMQADTKNTLRAMNSHSGELTSQTREQSFI